MRKPLENLTSLENINFLITLKITVEVDAVDAGMFAKELLFCGVVCSEVVGEFLAGTEGGGEFSFGTDGRKGD